MDQRIKCYLLGLQTWAGFLYFLTRWWVSFNRTMDSLKQRCRQNLAHCSVLLSIGRLGAVAVPSGIILYPSIPLVSSGYCLPFTQVRNAGIKKGAGTRDRLCTGADAFLDFIPLWETTFCLAETSIYLLGIAAKAPLCLVIFAVSWILPWLTF